MELTEEKKNINFSLWIKKLKEYNCYSESLINELGDKLYNAPYNTKVENGGCYDGGLIDVVLNNLCVLGFHINENAYGKNDKGRFKHPFLGVNKEMLMRVLLLQHISKCEMFVKCNEDWKIRNGNLYEFSKENETQLKLGERSTYLCSKHGIELSESEYEAMLFCDKNEKEFNPYITPFSMLIKFVNQMVAVELYRKQKYLNSKKEI